MPSGYKHVHVHNTCYKTHKALQQINHYSELGYDNDDGLQTAPPGPQRQCGTSSYLPGGYDRLLPAENTAGT